MFFLFFKVCFCAFNCLVNIYSFSTMTKFHRAIYICSKRTFKGWLAVAKGSQTRNATKEIPANIRWKRNHIRLIGTVAVMSQVQSLTSLVKGSQIAGLGKTSVSDL